MNEGTLYGGGSPLAGIRWTPEQLRSRYQLTDTQIALYQEYLEATAESVDILAKAQIAAHAKRNDLSFDRDMSLPDMAANAVEQLQAAVEESSDRLAMLNDEDFLNDAMDSTGEPEMQKAMYEREAKEHGEKIDRMLKTIANVNAIAERAELMREAGYKPLMRFGKYTVTAHDAEGVVAFHGMFEGTPFVPKSGKLEARRVAEQLQKDNPDWTITRGEMSEEAYKLYGGVNLEALELFAEHMDASEREPYQEYLRKAINNRSALKRMIERKGTAGYSTDARRTLAQFVISNGRLAAAQYHLTDMRKAAAAIPKEQGGIQTEAVNLHQYLTNPSEEAAGLRGFLFFNYIGGSLASAMINLTQVPAVTAPYLSQFTGYGNVVKQLTEAAKLGLRDPKTISGKLGEALRRAEDEGVTAPQEIYQLMAIASNNFLAGAKTARFALQAWSKFFSSAEQFNRRVTFIAAYRIAEANGKNAEEAFRLAETAVNDTQFIYNKGNRPNWARGAIGATLFTFKQFNIAYLELLKRMPWKQRGMMLGTLLLFAGAGGLPFAEDIEDLVDTLGQWLGFATNAKRSLRNAAKAAMGDTLSDVALRGVSAGLPFDISGRMGMGNLIPGTAILKQSEVNKGRDVAEAAGPVGSLIRSAGDALEALATGHFGRAVLAVSPTAARNAYLGGKMLVTGHGEDTQGRKTLDVSATAGAFKAIGFNPAALAEYSEVKQGLMETGNLLHVKQNEINSAWAEAIISRDPDGITAAKEKLVKWNMAHADHPELRLRFDPAAIRKRVIDAQLAGDVRFIRGTPKTLRREAAQELGR